jgi:rSAM/selenodomain-associated transferase 2
MISIIIPTLNEAELLPALLADLAREAAAAEVIVVDGGSIDDTAEIARRAGARLLRTAAGRGRQLAAGAQASQGEVLLFLHADSRFPAGGLRRISGSLAATPQAPGGNFRLVFDGGEGFGRWLTGFYAWIRRRGFYYGDSGIFVRRAVYESLGGIQPVALMEDYSLVRRLERSGPTVCIEDPPLVTSARRFRGRHPVAIVAGWLWIHLLYYLGIVPERLARRYYRSGGHRASWGPR